MRRLLAAAGIVLLRLRLAVTLLVAAAAVLLVSDWHQRRPGQANLPGVALVKYSSRPLMDELVEGVLAGLSQHGQQPDKTFALTQFSAENDMSTAASIAKQMAGGGYSLLITLGTPCLQAVAQANRDRRVNHVFGGVTDPFGAGVGIHRNDPFDHPAHLAGIGSFQPVPSLFQLMKRELFPGLRKVGAVWNPAEACSEACVLKARACCAELGLELLEANVDKSSDVGDAANALAARGVQVFWTGGDNTVDLAIDALIAAGRKARVPVVGHVPNQLSNGMCVALGANYRQVGFLAGEIAAQALQGVNLGKIPVKDVVPEYLGLNVLALANLQDPWRFPAAVRSRADTVLDETGLHTQGKTPVVTPSPPKVRPRKVFVIRYVDAPHAEDGSRGILAGLGEAGWKEGRDFTAAVHSAQGQISTLNSIMDVAKNDDVDLLAVVCTPALQAAMNRFTKTPIVYTSVASGVEVGAGRSATDHRPNVTGIDTRGSFSQMVDILRQCRPGLRKIGTLFSPGESNSVFNKTRLETECRQQGLALCATPVNAASDVADAVLALNGQGIEVLCQVPDNMSAACFASIIAAADRTSVPVFSFMSMQAEQGSVLAVVRDYFDAGREAGQLAARILRGEDPARIPIGLVSSTKLVVNLRQAAKYRIVIPETLLQRADKVIK